MVAQGGTTTDPGQQLYDPAAATIGEIAGWVPQEFQWEWLTIPTSTQALSIATPTASAISSCWPCIGMYQEQGKLVRAEISLSCSRRAGRKRHTQSFAEVGVDMNSQAFWQSGSDAISGMVDQLEQTMR